MTPWLSVVVPTIGRPSLAQTLDSLDAQPECDGVEVLVVGDSFGGETAELGQAREHVLTERDPVRYQWLDHDGGQHCFGQPQRTAGARVATAPWVWFTQDDNVAAAGAFQAIKQATEEHHRPLFFRWLAPWRQIIWSAPILAHSNIDADCLVLPHDIAERVQWGMRYDGDFDAAVQAFNFAGGNVGWCQPIISIARPHPGDLWWKAAA